MKTDPVLRDKAARFDKIVEAARSQFKFYEKLADSDRDKAAAEREKQDRSLLAWDRITRHDDDERYNRRVAHEAFKVLVLADATDGLVCGCHMCESVDRKKVSA